MQQFWATDPSVPARAVEREHVLPSGAGHLVFRLGGPPARVLEGAQGTSLPRAVVGGPRSRYYAKEVSGPARSVGVQLWPSAFGILTDAPASELANRHVALEDLWGSMASSVHQRLGDLTDPEAAIDYVEGVLMARLARVRVPHPAVAAALGGLVATGDVASAVQASGRSHRVFVERFRETMGVTPKVFCRTQRFLRTLDAVADDDWSLSEVAMRFGYADQSHLNREFREFAGVTPGQYRRATPRHRLHLPVTPG